MARNLHVYPKATLVSDVWEFMVKVFDQDALTASRFLHTEFAGVTAETPLRLLKLAFDMTVTDTDTDQDVDDAMYLDVAVGGPTNGETLWESWQTLAEGIIAGLPPGYTVRDFWVAWSKQDTARIRNAARRILINGRGWFIPAGSVHQHEGDGTVTKE